MKRPLPLLLAATLLAIVLLSLSSCKGTDESTSRSSGGKGKITYAIPTPEPVEIFWIDSAGNLGLRGVAGISPGIPGPDAKLPRGCRESAIANGNGVLTVCMEPTVGRVLAEKLGLDIWSSGTSPKP